MIEGLHELHEIPKEERKYLVLATPRSGSSTFMRVLNECLKLPIMNPPDSPFDEKAFSKRIKSKRGILTKFDPYNQTPEFLEYMIASYDKVVVLFRENIVEHALSNTRAGLYTYDGVYKINKDTEKIVEEKRMKPRVLASALKQTLFVLELAANYKIPILTYEQLYSGVGEDTWDILNSFGIKWKDIGDDIFNKVLQYMNPVNKYTNENSILKNIKGEIKLL